MHHSERSLLNHRKTLGFLASGQEEFNLGPEMRLDHSELLCNQVLLKYKGIRRGQKEYPFASVSHGVVYSLVITVNQKNVWRFAPIIYILR